MNVPNNGVREVESYSSRFDTALDQYIREWRSRQSAAYDTIPQSVDTGTGNVPVNRADVIRQEFDIYQTGIHSPVTVDTLLYVLTYEVSNSPVAKVIVKVRAAELDEAKLKALETIPFSPQSLRLIHWDASY